MIIRSIKIDNYKSFNHGDIIPFSKGYNVVVGKNDTGKSSLLSALTLQFGAMPHLSEITKPKHDSATDSGSKITITIEITRKEIVQHIEKEQSSFFHRLSNSLNLNNHQHVGRIEQYFNNIESITCEFIAVNGRMQSFQILKLPWEIDRHKMFRLSIEDGSIRCGNLGSGDNGLLFYLQLYEKFKREIYYFAPERYKVGNSSNGINAVLASDASNLPEVIDNLKSNRVREAKYIRLISEVFPEIKTITIENRQGNQVEIMLWGCNPENERKDLAVRLDMSGSGIGQVLAIVYVVMNSEDSRTIIIDEPQSFLHPGAIRRLFRVLDSYPQHQYILATHSPTVLSSIKNPSIVLLEKEKMETVSKTIDRNEVEHLREVMDKIGVRISDIFGSDDIIWVEGPTEEKIFPLLIDMSAKPATQFCAVKNTGDFTGKRAKLVFDIYDSISGGYRIIPPAICFIFDSENKTITQKEDLARRAKKPVHFLNRVMFENYILDAEAIAEIIRMRLDEYDIDGIEISTEIVDKWIEENFNNRRYYENEMINKDQIEELQLDGIVWVGKIDAAKFLKELYESILREKYRYDKMCDSVDIAKWLIERNKPMIIELKNEIEAMLQEA